jgi:hypothetical protein
VPQIIRPIDLESQVVKGMNHLMGHCVLEMSLVLHLICANQDAILWIETTTLSIRTAAAIDIVIMEIAS